MCEMDEETRRALDELRGYFDEELVDVRGDLQEHDRTLMALVRGRPRWASVTRNGAEPEPEELIGRLDSAAAALDRALDEDEQKLWERLLRLAPSTRALIGKLLSLPSGDERTALAYCLTVDDDERAELLAQITVIEERELDQAEAP